LIGSTLGVVYNSISGFDDLDYQQARNIEAHVKRMKSKQYLKNLSIYPAIIQKLIEKYPAGSSR